MKLEIQTEGLCCETATVYGQSKYIGVHALASAANSLAAAGAQYLSAGVHVTLPPDAYQSKIRAMERIIKDICTWQGIELAEVKGTKNPAVQLPAVVVTGVGAIGRKEVNSPKTVRPGQDIILTKWVGMDGMLQVAAEREMELKERFSPVFIRQIWSYKKELFAKKEVQIARSAGVSYLCQITEGGVLASLWNLAKTFHVGLKVDMKRIPILQETIEVCEQYRLNPYQLTSVGSFLMVTDNAEALIEALRLSRVQASIIGYTTGGNAKILHNGEDIRYIDRPAPDEVFKIFEGGIAGWKI